MNPIIEEIYKTGLVYDERRNAHKLHSEISRSEGEFLSKLIRSDPSIHKTLEIGCAFGLSSLHICSALSEKDSAKHIIIDPLQHRNWHGIGILNLKRAGFKCFKLIEKPSEFVLPNLAQNEPESFDLVFVDGYHTFDHTLLDLFYANRLVKVGGYIVIDDCKMPSVSKAVSYMVQYPAYRLHFNKLEGLKKMSLKRMVKYAIKAVIPQSIGGYLIPNNLYDNYYRRLLYSSMVSLKKIEDDKRSWNWFKPF